MWNIRNLCRFILFSPLLVTLIFLFIDGCSTIPRQKTYAVRGERYMKSEFGEIDLVRYNSLLQVLMDDIKKDASEMGFDEYRAKNLAFSWLTMNLFFTHQELFPGCSKEFFTTTLGEFYDMAKPYLENEETK